MIGGAAAEGMSPNSPAATPAPAAHRRRPPTPAAKSTDMTAAVDSSAKFINSQRQDQYLASKFKGTDVIGTDDKKIGDVSDILFDKDGKIEAYVVGVGGFLGIGAEGRGAGAERLPGRAGRQVEERVRQAAALHDQGRAEAGGELRAVQGSELDHRHGRDARVRSAARHRRLRPGTRPSPK